MAKTTNAFGENLSLFDTTSLWGFALDAPTTSPDAMRFTGDEDDAEDRDGGGNNRNTDGSDDTPPAPAAPRVPATTYRLIDTDRPLAQGWRARAADMIEAIRLARLIEDERRHATPGEQAQLALFTGCGASELANALFRRPGEEFRQGWAELGQALEALVPPNEMAGLARATQYAHYTPEFITRAMWAAVRRMGFSGGALLEPGCGSGLFLATMPEALSAGTAITAIENDPTTARIAKLLYPDAWVRAEDFTKARIVERFDLAIGNPPFSDRTVRADDPSGRRGLSLHEYFVARSIERLRPGGLAAFVCSRFLMDGTDPSGRAYIASMADFLGAVRMPAGAMQASSGTDIVVDILFFQKCDPASAPSKQDESAEDENVSAGPDWLGVAKIMPSSEPGSETEAGEGSLTINRYFASHPNMVLGTHGWTSSAFGPAYTCNRHPGTDEVRLAADLAAALARLPADIHVRTPEAPRDDARRSARPLIHVGTAAEGATVKEGSYILVDDRLMQVLDGEAEPVLIKGRAKTTTAAASADASVAKVKAKPPNPGIPLKQARIIRAMIPIREAIHDILRAQLENEPWGAAQVKLRVAYGSFTREFGPINHTDISRRAVPTSSGTDPASGDVTETQRRPNLSPFADDPDCWLVASIEDYDLESDTAKRGPIFSERVIHPPCEPLITCAADALAVILAEIGHVEMPAIAERLGRTEAEVIAELGEGVFLDPAGGTSWLEGAWTTADAYLSGLVRTKLDQAERAAAADSRYVRNVDALRRVQPVDLKPSDITARLGAPWITTADVADFCDQVIGIATKIRHTPEVAIWTVDQAPFAGEASATSLWGTARRHAGQLLHDALNASIPTIWDEWTDADGTHHRVINAKETEACKEKLTKIRDAFEAWIWTDADRTERLCRVYNDRYNNLVPRHFDGSHLTLPGASTAIQFRAHQKRGVWRIAASGNTYLAHAVGAGKTFLMAAAVMEQKRLGLAQKVMMTVPGHCLAQAAREFLQLYPMAKILVADETNFVAGKRHRFVARAATGLWDCIIITHSAFKLIATPAAFERAMIGDLMGAYREVLQRVDNDDRITRKRIEAMAEKMQARLDAMKSRKDDMLTIAEMGIDQIMVDEAQEFRKLSFATNMSTLKGIQPEGSQRAWDLYVKTRFIDTINPGRALIMASGTPITNTLAEMYTVQRYMDEGALRSRHMHAFDAWAAMFGDTRTELELQPSGLYKPVTRFAQFVNVADLMAMFRSFADVVTKADLRGFLKLPGIETGQRQLITAEPSPAFRWYQRHLAERISAIEERGGKPQKGDDILLSVITDGRHAAIDLRFVLDGYVNEDANKLNALVHNVHRIWNENRSQNYLRADGTPYATTGCAQLVFSDLGTMNVEATRGFSAYRWIRDELVRLGMPASQIAFMQDFKKSAAKQRLFGDVNAGRVSVLIGSSETMGTGVNAQLRLRALHHLDVPWLPSQIEQREGRIERQGNQNETIGLYAYATLGSTDATMWQANERKQRFIDAALSGDRSIRRIEDAQDAVSQFAMAKAIASGDPRLMMKAGLDAEIARLMRQRAAHIDDQQAVRAELFSAERRTASAERAVLAIEQDIGQRVPTRGDLFTMTVIDPDGKETTFSERPKAGAALLKELRNLDLRGTGDWTLARIGGFEVIGSRHKHKVFTSSYAVELILKRTATEEAFEHATETTALGIVSRLEHALDRFEAELAQARREVIENRRRAADYAPRLGLPFPLKAELDGKLAEMEALQASLADTAKAIGSDDPFGLDDLKLTVKRRNAANDDESHEQSGGHQTAA